MQSKETKMVVDHKKYNEGYRYVATPTNLQFERLYLKSMKQVVILLRDLYPSYTFTVEIIEPA